MTEKSGPACDMLGNYVVCSGGLKYVHHCDPLTAKYEIKGQRLHLHLKI